MKDKGARSRLAADFPYERKTSPKREAGDVNVGKNAKGQNQVAKGGMG